MNRMYQINKQAIYLPNETKIVRTKGNQSEPKSTKIASTS